VVVDSYFDGQVTEQLERKRNQSPRSLISARTSVWESESVVKGPYWRPNKREESEIGLQGALLAPEQACGRQNRSPIPMKCINLLVVSSLEH